MDIDSNKINFSFFKFTLSLLQKKTKMIVGLLKIKSLTAHA